MELENPIHQLNTEEQLNCITIGLRVTCVDHEEIHDWYIRHFREWLLYRKYQILATSFGIHLNAESPHIHYAVVATGKLLSNPLATLKRDFDLGKIKTEYNPKETSPYYRLPEFFTSERYRGRINLSLQMKSQISIGEDVFNFLQYPFKEGLTNSKWNYNLDEYGGQSQLQEKAIAIYQSRRKELEKKKKKEEKDLSEWDKLVKYLDNQDLDTHYQVHLFCLTYYRSLEKKPPSLNYMRDQAEKYSFLRRIISDEEIIASGRRF